MKPIYGKKHWRDRLTETQPKSWTKEFEKMMKRLREWMETR